MQYQHRSVVLVWPLTESEGTMHDAGFTAATEITLTGKHDSS